MESKNKMNLQTWLHSVITQKARPAVMGILNITPDSFSDGGSLSSKSQLLAQVETMIKAGVDILDVGGESTRPGADPVSLDEELSRVLPAIASIREITDLPISIDTYKPQVMRAAIEAGANLINDVNALQAEGALEVAASLQVPVCLMHKKGNPKTMQQQVVYENVVAEVVAFLEQRVEACLVSGIKKNQILLDPGFGFGKELAHNVSLFQAIPALLEKGWPLLIGVSRKKMIGQLVQGVQSQACEEVPPQERVVGSVVAAVMAAQAGAKVLRVHDVKQTIDALNVYSGLNGAFPIGNGV